MKKYKINTSCYVQNVYEHIQLKKIILEYININSIQKLEEKEDIISNTDWHESDKPDRPYVKLLKDVLAPYLLNVSKDLRMLEYRINNMWFQQYLLNSKHNWHTHPGVNWSAIYYVEMKSDSVKTELYDLTENKIIQGIELKEGDLFVFPSNILHRSPPNLTNDRKTIISFNLDFDNTDTVF